ncbi:hypothetical protein P3T40_005138 [Paraburkholderia sp. EB58]|jgi:hypothetical protein
MEVTIYSGRAARPVVGYGAFCNFRRIPNVFGEPLRG